MHDLRDAYRALKSTPIVTGVAILSLALGIGANTAMFSILNSLLLRSLPVRNAEELVLVGEVTGPSSYTNPIWEAVRSHRDLFGNAAAWSQSRFNIAGGGQTQFVDGIWTSGGYFDLLGVPALLGRTLTEADDRRGGGPDGPVAVIGYDFWQRHFGGAADVVGRSLTVERVPFTIVGVMPRSFFGTDVGRSLDVAIPLGTEPIIRGKETWLDHRSAWWLSIILRLKAGQSLDAAAAALHGVQPQIRLATLPEQYPEAEKPKYLASPLQLRPAATGDSGLRRRYQRPMIALMIVVSLVLLIACANIANLLLARATARRHEISVRVALGASRFRLARQLLTESLMLAGTGALLGLLFARWGTSVLVGALSTSTNRVVLDTSTDLRVLLFTFAVTLATSIIFGVSPAFLAARVQPNDALKAQGRSLAGDARFSLGNLLVIAQVGLSLILVVAAVLFVRTFSTLAHLELGLDSRGVLMASVNTQPLQLDPDARAAFFERLRQAAAAVPGVDSAAISVVTPVAGGVWNTDVDIPDGVTRTGRQRMSNVNLVSPDWPRTFGTRLLAGRDFSLADTKNAAPVLIVNEAFARKFFGGKNPIGLHVIQPGSRTRPSVDREIVGYVADAVYSSLREPVPATLYIPIAQSPEPPSTMTISVRTTHGTPFQLMKPVTSALTSVDGSIAVTLRPLDDQVSAALTQERIVAMLSGFFGALALLLAGLGLYGITSYAVSRRRSEIGIRMALGAAPAGVLRLVLRRVALLVGIGIVAGTAVSLWASRFVSTLLFGLDPRDPGTFATAGVLLAVVGAMAGWIPARRAARLDPARVLREG